MALALARSARPMPMPRPRPMLPRPVGARASSPAVAAAAAAAAPAARATVSASKARVDFVASRASSSLFMASDMRLPVAAPALAPLLPPLKRHSPDRRDLFVGLGAVGLVLSAPLLPLRLLSVAAPKLPTLALGG